VDTGDFRRASLTVWQAMAPGWDARHAYFESVARPVTRVMLERLDPSPGETVLDLAAGTGIVGFSAAGLVGERGRILVSDFSDAMVESAARHAEELGLENVECRVLDAEQLELSDDSIDGVVCRWGLMLIADPAAALQETRRVLRPGGRTASAVFAGPEENPWAALPSRVLQEHGHMSPPEPGAPGILALADRNRLTRLFTEAGFVDPVIEEVPFDLEFAGMDDYWDFLTGVAGAIAMLLERLSADDRERVRAELATRLGTAGSERFELPAKSLVVSAGRR
jgi:SAM-dependent methyltransferase